MEKLSIKESHHWHFIYRGITIEIIQHWREDYDYPGTKKELWNYYLIMREDQIPEEKRSQFICTKVVSQYGSWYYNYYQSALADLDWHGGITFYELLSAESPKIFKAGCDFDHIWNHGHKYNVDYIMAAAKNTVDDLWEQHPDLFVRCNWTGKFFPASEMSPWNDGYISKEGEELRQQSVKNATAVTS